MKWTASAVIAWLALLSAMGQPTGPGSALSFNGTGYVSIATTGSLTSTFTVELWANPSVNTPNDLLALVGSRTPAEFGFDMKFWLGHLIHGDIGDGSTWLTIVADTEYRYVPGEWVHLAYVVTPTNYSIYANGLSMAGGDYPLADPVLYDANHQLTIGHIGYGPEYMTGQIDEVRVWNRALDQTEIQANLQRALSGSEAGLMGYWRLDEGSGMIVNDSSGHGFIGLLFNGPTWVSSTAPIGVLAATTEPASAVTPTSATLHGIVFPDYQNASAWFEYGTTSNYGSSTTPTPIDATSGTPVAVDNQISGLSLGTVYHFRLVATNGAVTSLGADVTFTASAAPLVANGGFETGDFTGWTLTGYPYQNWVDTIPPVVHSGNYGAALGAAGSLGYLSQAVPTAPGHSYLISFWLHNPTGLTPNEFSVTWDGNTLFDTVDAPAMDWSLMQFESVATTPSTALEFAFQDDPEYWGLDDVSVAEIPLPEFLPGGPAVTNGGLALTWASLAGLVYQLQYTTSLNPAAWDDLGSPITAVGPTTTTLDPIGSDPQRFYRVVLLH